MYTAIEYSCITKTGGVDDFNLRMLRLQHSAQCVQLWDIARRPHHGLFLVEI